MKCSQPTPVPKPRELTKTRLLAVKAVAQDGEGPAQTASDVGVVFQPVSATRAIDLSLARQTLSPSLPHPNGLALETKQLGLATRSVQASGEAK